MYSVASPAIHKLPAAHFSPAVSVIMPFEPKMTPKAELVDSLETAFEKVEVELMENYPGDLSLLVLQKLKDIINSLNFNTHKKSIAVYVSPLFEKVLYLDIAVDEKIVVDESFEIRNLVYSKKQLHKYLILRLSSNESHIYLGNSCSFIKIVSNNPAAVSDDIKEATGKTTTDISERDEVLLHRLLHQVDNALGIILNAYPLPLFILGTEKILAGFKAITKHNGSVIEYIRCACEEAELLDLKETMKPHITNWRDVLQKDIQNRLEEAFGKKKLAVGMQEVWQAARNHKGCLLVLEKDFIDAAYHEGSGDIISKTISPHSKFSYIKDAVDDVIEKVFENGGDVEFADKNVLGDYKHIALVQYF